MAAHKTIGAVADEVVQRGASVAGGPIVAGSRGTGITGCPHFTAPAREASRAGAHEPILQVMAGATMGTRAAGTIADMKFTVGACESRTAAAYAVRASVQALAPCGYTQGTSQQLPGNLSGAEGECFISGMSSGPPASMNAASIYRSHYKEH